MGAADIEREEQDEAALGCNLAHTSGDTAAESISHTTWFAVLAIALMPEVLALADAPS